MTELFLGDLGDQTLERLDDGLAVFCSSVVNAIQTQLGAVARVQNERQNLAQLVGHLDDLLVIGVSEQQLRNNVLKR
jgi:hypothetical protein